jgi:peptide/nickel transport system ATP-binding protein/oligopeptide transport system ATP-binding protein
MTAAVDVVDLGKRYGAHRGLAARRRPPVHAVRSVSFQIEAGTTLALVGESGAGKSTVGRLVLRLIDPDSGVVRIDGEDVLALPKRRLLGLRERTAMVFQDPHASFNPRMTLGEAVGEPFAVHRSMKAGELDAAVADLFAQVGLRPEFRSRFPHQLSGGQLQRAAIARAIALRPKLIVCDEPVAALDVSIRAQILNLLAELQSTLGLTYLFVSHDLSVVEHFADAVAVMRHGEIVERGQTEAIFSAPEHEHTIDLLNAIPRIRTSRRRPRTRDAAPLLGTTSPP